MTALPTPSLPPAMLKACHGMNLTRHLVRLATFATLYLVSASAAVVAAGHISSAWQWLLLVPLYLLAAASLHGISLFTHEAVHGTLCRNRLCNDVLGAVCAIPVLQNCSAYRVLHLRHHQHLGDNDDPDHYASYTRWTWLVFLMNWLRLLIGYPVYITAIPLLGFKHGTGRDKVRIMMEVTATTILIGAIWMSSVPSASLLHGWLIPMLFINTMVNIRGMSQHTLLEDSADEVRGTRTILTVPLVRFFMCNENFHLEHHLYPGVPWHHLHEVHAALKDDLTAQGAPYITSYSAFVGEFIRHSFHRSPLGQRHHASKP